MDHVSDGFDDPTRTPAWKAITNPKIALLLASFATLADRPIFLELAAVPATAQLGWPQARQQHMLHEAAQEFVGRQRHRLVTILALPAERPAGRMT